MYSLLKNEFDLRKEELYRIRAVEKNIGNGLHVVWINFKKLHIVFSSFINLS